MSQSRRGEQIELNFDGLADTVTNLVGALILLLVLIIGITSEAASQGEPAKPEPPPTQDAGDRSIASLQQRIALLQTQLREVDRDVSQAKTRLAEAQDEVEQLIEKVQKIQPPKPEPPAEKPKDEQARKVLFRPPFEKFDVGKNETSFVVVNGRVSFLDFEALNVLIRSKTNGKKTQRVEFLDEIPGTDFRLQGWVKGGELDLTVVRQENKPGEPLNRLSDVNSKFRRKLAALDTKKQTIDFIVFPDSYDAYRLARTLAWDASFDVGWNPRSAGETIRLGQGVGVGATSQ